MSFYATLSGMVICADGATFSNLLSRLELGGWIEKDRFVCEDGEQVTPDNTNVLHSELTFINLTARVEDAGKFSIANLPPGEYKIFAFEEVDMATASDPEFLKKFEDRAGSVKIGEGESKSLSLKQIRYAETTSAPA